MKLQSIILMAITSVISTPLPENGAKAEGKVEGSPGFLSGDEVQVPINVPVNACGISLSVIGLLNPAFGNECVNH